MSIILKTCESYDVEWICFLGCFYPWARKMIPYMCPTRCCLQHYFPFMTSFNSYYNRIPISQTRRQRLQDQEIISIITLHLKGKALYCTSCQPPAPFARNDKSILCLTKEQTQLLSFMWFSFYISSYGASKSLWGEGLS